MYGELKRNYNNGDFKDIIEIYKDCDHCDMIEQEIFGNRVQVLPMNGDSEAEMLIRLFPQNAITIARMSVSNHGIGVGSKIIESIIDYAKRNNLETVYLECIMTVEMLNLALKYKFEPILYRTFMHENYLFGDYKIDIK